MISSSFPNCPKYSLIEINNTRQVKNRKTLPCHVL
jgi:hypothetical protein